MENECNIAGFAVTTECGEITIEKVPAIDFHLLFIDTLAGLLEQSKEPRITVSLFKPKEVPKLGVVIIPNDISDTTQTESKKTFLFRLNLITSDTVIREAYAKVLNLTKICINVLKTVQRRLKLTIVIKTTIINSNEIALSLVVSKLV